MVVVKYFDRGFHQRFWKKYPKESDDFKFMADDSKMKSLNSTTTDFAE
jgi:hypothetical protein